MFSPIGYRSVAVLQKEFRDVAEELLPIPEIDNSSSGFTDDEQLVSLAWNRWAQLTEALLNYLHSGVHLYLCLQTGKVLNVHSSVIAREKAADKTGFAGYWVLDAKRWMVDTRRAKDWIERSNKSLERLRDIARSKRQTGRSPEKDQSKIRKLNRTIGRATFFVESFEGFNGASLVISEENAPTVSDIKGFLGQAPEELSLSVGRPSDRETIISSYQRLFPGGNSGRSWKQITSDIGDDTGIYVHPDTVKRALGLKK